VTEAIRSGAPLATVLVTEAFGNSAEGAAVATLAAENGISVEPVPARELERIADTKTPQGIVGVVRAVETDEGDVAATGLILALDAVSDPGNAGTLVRTADAFAVRAVLFGPGSADPENPKTLRAAMGSNFHVPLVRARDLPARLGALRDAGAIVIAATLDGASLYDVNTAAPGRVLVLGSEAHGVSDAVRAVADREVTVP